MKFPISVIDRKQTASFRIVGLMLMIAPLWLMLASANTPATAQTSHHEGNRRQQVIACSHQLTARNAVRMAAAVSKLVSAAFQHP